MGIVVENEVNREKIAKENYWVLQLNKREREYIIQIVYTCKLVRERELSIERLCLDEHKESKIRVREVCSSYKKKKKIDNW